MRLARFLTCAALSCSFASAHSGQPSVAASTISGFGLSTTGIVWAWGAGSRGQTGPNGSFQTSVPVQVTGVTNVTALGGGDYHTVALTSLGQVYVWGDNTYGQMGDNSALSSSNHAPKLVPGLSGVVQVAAGLYHTLALKSDGTVWAWGINTSGELGDGSTTQRNVPVKVSGLAGIVKIGSGGSASHSFAIASNGSVWAWGKNVNGQLGDSSTVNRSVPVQVSGLTNVVQVGAAQQHSVALKVDGTVWSWGNNGSSQLGDRTTTQRLTPVQVYDSSTTFLGGVKEISVGDGFAFATKADRTVWAWGSGVYGSFGDGLTSHPNYAKLVVQLEAMKVAAGEEFGLGLKDDGSVWAWGRNFRGELGDNTSISSIGTQQNSPIRVHGQNNVGFLNLTTPIVVPSASSLALSATSLAFSSQNLGSSSVVKTIVLANSGVDTLSIASIASGGDFGTTHTCGATLGPGARCNVNVVFTPTLTGSRTSTVVITSNAANSPNTIALTGTGVISAPSAPTSENVVSGGGRVTLYFIASTSNGGAEISNYTATCAASGQVTQTASGMGSPLIVRGLVAGVSYNCSLTATNAAGLTGLASVVTQVTPTQMFNMDSNIIMLMLD